MRGRRKSSGSSLRVRFLGSEQGNAHARWYRTIAEHYDRMYDPLRVPRAYAFLQHLFRRRAVGRDVVDVACGTFALDLPLVKRGYKVVGFDRSSDMLRVARRTLQEAGRVAELGDGDLRSLHLDRTFDALLCLGTAFNYVTRPADVRKAFQTFRRLVRVGGLVVLDLTNFDAWIRHPENVRAEVDYRSPNGTRIAIFAFNEQDLRRRMHFARFLTVLQQGRRVDLRLDAAPLRMWSKSELDRALRSAGFRPIEWWGDLRLGAKYERSRSPRIVSVSVRR
jgi:ubiquinone/menaquinone biosynthesis C-methylase UbiE